MRETIYRKLEELYQIEFKIFFFLNIGNGLKNGMWMWICITGYWFSIHEQYYQQCTNLF